MGLNINPINVKINLFYFNTFITTRLFWALPSLVVLSATGNDGP